MHSYQKDTTIDRPFSITNTGSFFRASRFIDPIDDATGEKVSVGSGSPRKVHSRNRSLGSGGRAQSPDLMVVNEKLNFTKKSEGTHSTAALNTI